MSENKLYRPNHCDIPLEVRECKGLVDGCKIYFGELNAISHRKHMIYATDEQLAETFDIALRTLKRWHAQLEDNGFITRINYQESFINEEGIKCWRNLRNIRINFGFINRSNKVCESAKNGPLEIVPKMALPESAKNGTSQNNKRIHKEEQQQAPCQAPESAAVSFDEFSLEEVSLYERRWMIQNFSTERILNAKQYTLKAIKNQEIKTTIVQTLKWACQANPEISLSEEEIILENKVYAKTFLPFENECYKLELMNKQAEVTFLNSQLEPFCIKYDEKGFKTILSSKINELKEKYEIYKNHKAL